MDHIIEKFREPGHPAAFSSPDNVARVLGVKKDTAKHALEHIDSYVLHREYKRPKSFNPYFIYSRRELVQGDLIDVQNIAKENDGVKHLFLLIDVFTRKMWVFPLKSKRGVDVRDALQKWFDMLRVKPTVIGVDGGKEFWNEPVKRLLARERVRLQLAVGTSKAAYAERANKSLQILIYKYLTDRETLRYIDQLQKLVETYNSRGHRSLKYMSPDEAEQDENQNRVLSIATQRFQKVRPKHPKLNVGDMVRVKTDAKKITDATRAYAEQFEGEYFKVDSINTLLPIPLYFIRSEDTGELIDGGFYAEELQRVRIKNNVFKIERILQERGRGRNKEYKVRWKWYGPQWDSWLPASTVDDL